MRARLAAISTRYDAIEKLIVRLVSSSGKAAARPSSAPTGYQDVPVSAAREEMDEAVAGFFAAAKLDASAIEHPAFFHLLEVRRRYAAHDYQPPQSTKLRERLPTLSANSQSDGFAAVYAGDTNLSRVSAGEVRELH